MGLLTSEYYSGFCCNAPLNDVLFRSEDWSFKQQESILSGGAGVQRLVGLKLDIQTKDYPIFIQHISNIYPNPRFILYKS